MKITLYTIKDCAFSKQEKEYLNTNKLVFEEKDLETNKDFLTEMLAISNNFAGTPVTRVEKDDGTITVLKGFTKEEFDTTFGLVATPPVTEVPPATPAESVSPAPIETPPTETPASPAVSNDPLKSVMDNLQSQSVPTMSPAEPTTPPVIETPVVPPVPETPPVVPPPGAPAIPDFPTK